MNYKLILDTVLKNHPELKSEVDNIIKDIHENDSNIETSSFDYIKKQYATWGGPKG